MKLLSLLPFLTLLIAIGFWLQLFRHYYQQKFRHPYMYWCLTGIFLFALESAAEGYDVLWGWSELNFRCWYISGTLLGGAPLAQAYCYHLFKRTVANRMAMIVLLVAIAGTVAVWGSPIDQIQALPEPFSGHHFTWTWIAGISPIMNAYAIIFMVGGAIWSATTFYKRPDAGNLFWANVLIASAIFLLETGESFLMIGYDEFEFVTDLLGLICLMIAFKMIQHEPFVYPDYETVTS